MASKRVRSWFLRQAPKLSRSALVGVAATAADFAVLTALVQGAGVPAARANAFSLLVGSAANFLGNRKFTFSAAGAALGPQALRYGLIEVGAYAANTGLYALLVGPLEIQFLIAKPLGTGLVFLFYSYPLWHWVFRKRA